MLIHSLRLFSRMPRFACQSGLLFTAHQLGALALACAGIGAVTPPSYAARQMYEVVAQLQGPTCPGFPTPEAVPWSINDQNEVVGYYDICGFGSRRAFYWSQETGVVTLSFPFAISESRAYDISDNGWIVGTVNLPGDSFGALGFVMRPDGSGLELILPLPGQVHCEARAVNDDKIVVGYSVGLFGPNTAFVWTGRLPTSLEPALGTRNSHAYDINSFGVVCGTAGPSIPYISQAFLWGGLSVTDLGTVPGAKSGVARAVNDKGEAAVEGMISYSPAPVIYHGYFYSGGQLTQIIPPDPAASVRVYALNDTGVVVGKVTPPTPAPYYAFAWRDGEFTALHSAIVGTYVEEVLYATSVNNAGWITVHADFDEKAPEVGAVLRPVAVPGDLSGDGLVNGIDLAMLLAAWGSADSQADLDGDLFVGGMDLALLLGLWTP